MPLFNGADGTRLAYHMAGDGRPLVCLPGGPMLASTYLGDLGGLSAQRQLVLLDLRGTGESAIPADPATYRCDHQVEDVEALRAHLGLDRLDLLAHSAGATLALLYAAAHPERVERLILVTPSPRPVGLPIADRDRRAAAQLRQGEPWFPAAYAAFERVWSGDATDADWDAITPFSWGRWDDASRAQADRWEHLRNADAADAYYSAGAFDPAQVRAAVARFASPVLLLAGGYDVALPPPRASEYAGLFTRATLGVQSAAGHYPWLDDPEWFCSTVTGFTDRSPAGA